MEKIRKHIISVIKNIINVLIIIQNKIASGLLFRKVWFLKFKNAQIIAKQNSLFIINVMVINHYLLIKA